ncbi:MAG: hypothetical protein IJU84_03970 [Clostridia bacterium]|nr:hypothetical protein [Clostridia bacterium]
MDMIKYSIDNWRINVGEYGVFYAKTPCSVFSVLIDNGAIRHPYYDGNEKEMLALSDNDYEFDAEFIVGTEQLKRQKQILRFRGLDTICEILLNGQRIGRTKNFFRSYEFDCEKILRLGKNSLKIRFYSPTKYIAEKEKTHPVWSEVITMKGAAQIRKPIFTFGWDWAPVLPDIGIIGGAELLSFDSRIKSTDIYQEHSPDGATLRIKVKADALGKEIFRYTLLYGEEKIASATTEKNDVELFVPSPKLWWPRGYGEQNLYCLKIEMISDGTVVDTLIRNIGLRTMKINVETDEIGRKFEIEVNSVKIFALGANYVPADSILSHITRKKVQNVLEVALFQNCNLIRVWGGGYYPDEYFYDFCDKNGLIVWLDYMIACEDVRLEDGGLEEYVAELIENVNAVKHRACLGLICGNNEGEDKLKDRTENKDAVKDYTWLFEKEFPRIMREIAPETFYWQSSPSNTGNFDKTNNPAYGDSHCWGVWFADKPFDYYKGDDVRFCSEFGYESLPDIRTIKMFTETDGNELIPAVLRSRERTGVFDGIEKILHDVKDKYGKVGKLKELVYLSQLLQAQAIGEGVKYFRKTRGKCMGAIYWQLNDCWPCISHSSVDYFGRKKALSYELKKYYAPVLLIAECEGDSVIFSVANESRNVFHGIARWQISDNGFGVLEEGIIEVSVLGFSVKTIGRIRLSETVLKRVDSVFMVAELFGQDDEPVSKETMLFVKPKDYKYVEPTIAFDVFRKDEDKCIVKIRANGFVNKLYVDTGAENIDLSENYLDFTDKKEKSIIFRYFGDIENIKKSISFISINKILGDGTNV